MKMHYRKLMQVDCDGCYDDYYRKCWMNWSLLMKRLKLQRRDDLHDDESLLHDDEQRQLERAQLGGKLREDRTLGGGDDDDSLRDEVAVEAYMNKMQMLLLVVAGKLLGSVRLLTSTSN